MKIPNLTMQCLVLLAASGAAFHAEAAEKTLTIGARKLTLQPAATCAPAHRTGTELARNLVQYDPSEEPRENIADETPWTKEEIRLTRESLVENGFHYPNGQDSVITWMDVDGDGFCDFSASTGIGGAKPIDRIFLFRGLPKREFRLAASSYTYMEGAIALIPYIPIRLAEEKLPLVVSQETLMQWHATRGQFATCETIQYGPQAASQRAALPALAALCPQARRIYDWAASQLPRGNALPH